MQIQEKVRKFISHRYAGLFVIAIAAAVLLLGGFLNKQAVTRQLHDWKALPEPERFTELYFTDHTTLPTVYRPGQTQQFQFTIHNSEHRRTRYTYQLFYRSGAEGATLTPASSPQSIDLDSDRTAKAPASPTIPDLGERVGVTVSLEGGSGTGQQINYWVTKE